MMQKHRRCTCKIAAAVHVLHEPQHVVVLNLGCVPILQNGSEPQLNSERGSEAGGSDVNGDSD
jgi:hypothetical protein